MFSGNCNLRQKLDDAHAAGRDGETDGAAFKRASEWTTDAELKVDGGAVTLNVPPGGVRIVELLP